MIFSPVADPAGPWGLCIAQVPDLAAARRSPTATRPCEVVSGTTKSSSCSPRCSLTISRAIQARNPLP